MEAFVPRLYDQLTDALAHDRPAALATIIRGPGLGAKRLIFDTTADGDLPYDLAASVDADARALLRAETPGARVYATPDGEAEIFVEVYPAAPKLVIVGGVHIAIPLAQYARILGYRVILVDARTAFASEARFPHADRIVIGWPDEALTELGLDSSTYVAILTHDPKLDDPALIAALASPARYVGAIGSPKTHARRLVRLRDAGLSDDALARIHSPIGLDLGARAPEEIATSIIAEMVAVKYGTTWRPGPETWDSRVQVQDDPNITG